MIRVATLWMQVLRHFNKEVSKFRYRVEVGAGEDPLLRVWVLRVG